MTDDPAPESLDGKVMARFAILNFVLVCAGLCPGFGCGLQREYEMWLWVVAFPARAAAAVWGWEGLACTLLVLNPIIYGIVWWFTWKMWRVMRSEPTDDEAEPPPPEK